MLILFDIDGTLLHTGGLSKTLYFRSIEETFGVSVSSINLPWRGLTDYGIAYQLLNQNGVPAAEIEAGIPIAFERLDQLWTEHGDPAKITLYPGVEPLFAALVGLPNVEIGYFTANCRAGAEHKIRLSRLDDEQAHFQIRLAGDTVHTKTELLQTRIGELRADKHLIWVLGDSPTDIESAHACGLKGMGVTTGFYDESSLSQTQPEALLHNLSDTARVLQVLGLL